MDSHSTSEMEQLIQDTSYRAVDVTEQYRDCTERQCIGNGCSKTFSTYDENACMFMNYCADCTLKMRAGFDQPGNSSCYNSHCCFLMLQCR